MDSRVGNAQFTSDVCNRLSSALSEPHRLALTLLRNGLLDFLHNLGPSAVRIYSHLLLLHVTGAISVECKGYALEGFSTVRRDGASLYGTMTLLSLPKNARQSLEPETVECLLNLLAFDDPHTLWALSTRLTLADEGSDIGDTAGIPPLIVVPTHNPHHMLVV